MADTKISAAADIATLVGTDMVPVARSGDSSAYHATMAEVSSFVAAGVGGVTSWNTRVGAVTLTTADVTTALGYTPYNTTNPASYQTAADVTTALVPYALLASPTFTGTPTLPTGAVAVTQTKGNNTTALATTAFVLANAGAGGASITVSDTAPGSPTSGALWWDSVGGQLYLWYVDANSSQWVVANSGGALVPAASTTTPIMDGTAAVGTGTTYARADHVHPSDTSRAPLAAPVFTGDARAVTPAVGDNDTSIATTAFVQSAVAPALNNVGRNLLHNSLFSVAQRGVGPFTAAAAYTVDRWQIALNSDTVSVSQTAPGVQAGLDEAAAVVLRNVFTGTAGAAAFNQIGQKIEKVGRLSGQTVTISFTALASAAGLKLGANLYQSFGTGGSPSAGAYIQPTGASFTLTTGWVRYSATFTVPGISGKTLGTNGDDWTQISLTFSSGATNNAVLGNPGVQSGTVYLWGVQLEIGSVATPPEKPDPQQDLAKCQRFYQTIQFLLAAGGTAGTLFGGRVSLPTAMRAVPTVTPTITTQTNIPTMSVGPDVTTISFYGTATATTGTALQGSFLASADL